MDKGSNNHLLTLEQYETSLHALQASVPGFLQIVYLEGWTLAQGKVIGGGYGGCKDCSIICRNVCWSWSPELLTSMGREAVMFVAGWGGRGLIFFLGVDKSCLKARRASICASAGVRVAAENTFVNSSIVVGEESHRRNAARARVSPGPSG